MLSYDGRLTGDLTAHHGIDKSFRMSHYSSLSTYDFIDTS